MFTGLVETVGRIEGVDDGPRHRRLELSSPFTDLVVGESVAVDGVCLTVEVDRGGLFSVCCGDETLRVTALGRRTVGRRVHLERALRVGDRLGGHFVTGHVDGLGVLASRESVGAGLTLAIDVPAALRGYFAPKGSVTLDGVSLTVNAVVGNRVWVHLIPHTLQGTHLGEHEVGEDLHVEVDPIARHVVTWLTREER